MISLRKKKEPLLKTSIVHTLPGRVRVNCRALKYLGDVIIEIEEDLNSMKFIESAKVNTITKNALILYDKEQVGQEDIIGFFEHIISKHSLMAYQNEREEKRLKLSGEKVVEESVKDIAKRVAINVAAIAVSALVKGGLKSGLIKDSKLSRFTTIPALASLYLTKPIAKSGLEGFKEDLKPNADALTTTAIFASLAVGNGMSALTVILLSEIAELLTAYTMSKTRDSIKGMMNLKDEFVWKVSQNGEVKKQRVDSIVKGDTVLIQTGEKVCIDGEVISGEAIIDEAAVTGEYMPDIKREGSYVYAGGIVKNGSIKVSTVKVGDDTVVSRIISMVEDASSQKAPIQNYADHFSGYLIPFNFLLAGITYAVTKSSTRALNMLVIDYSCGIKLSTATAFSASINTAVKNGVLVKGGNYIEALSNSDTIIFDKTGTLTEGKPDVVDILIADNRYTERRIIELALAAEETSSHPIAQAILSKGVKDGIDIIEHSEIITHVARGTETTVEDDRVVRVGNNAFMKENDIDTSKIEGGVQILISKGQSVVYVSLDDKLIGVIGIQDKMRGNMKKSINNLRFKKVDDIQLLTGDISEQAEVVANRIGVDSYRGELLPEDKAKTVLSLQSEGAKVVMVGDGINDAPALAYADVGISLGGKSTDVAMETSDITIQSDNPMMIPTVIGLSKQTMNIVRQNFGFAIGINTVGLMMGATGYLPVFWGAVLHNSSTILVVMNSLRLLLFDMERGN
ncbi:MAG: heavy metal translocating P-type ATPase [Tissierella sp.]|uniref:heavy metal translocating P-type ATPase n=1 Tax=Tissierella sp. TaxID=41274 RepID=UPI003F967438